MIVGLGMDVVELDRIARSLDRFGERFLARVLTQRERAALPRLAVPFLAARFAAKEAAAKALGTGFRQGVTLASIEIRALPSGQPELVLHGAAKAIAARLGAARSHVSLTHGRDVAAAVVVLES